MLFRISSTAYIYKFNVLWVDMYISVDVYLSENKILYTIVSDILQKKPHFKRKTDKNWPFGILF